MTRFAKLETICEVLTSAGWFALIVGILMFLTILESGSMGVATAGISLAGSGTTAILLAGAVQVLIGIYKNTYPLAGPEEKLETPAPDTQQEWYG